MRLLKEMCSLQFVSMRDLGSSGTQRKKSGATVSYTHLDVYKRQGLNTLFAELDWTRLGRLLTDKLKILFETLHGFLQTFDWSALGHDLAALLIAAFNNVNWAQAAADLGGLFSGLLTAINTAITDIDWGSVGQTVWEMIAAIDWGGILGRIGLVILAAGGALLEAVGGLFRGIAEQCGDGFFGGLFQAFANVFNWLKENIVDPLVNGIKELLGIHSPSTVFFDFGVNLVEGLFNGLSSIWNKITGFFSEKLGDIKKKIGDAWTNIKENTFEVFSKVKDTIADIWENGIVGKIKGAVNSILSFMNRLLAGAADMVNGLIDVLNNFKVDVPKGVPLIGGTSFGFAIPHVSAPQIPLLAKGGVIEQPTLAMMGEYAGAGQNPEVAAPQSLLREMFGESIAPLAEAIRELLAVLRDALDSGEPQPIELYIGDELLDRLIVSSNNRRALRTGGR